MNKYFTKEYIKECDCGEMQELKKIIEDGDWYYFKGKDKPGIYCYAFTSTANTSGVVWLPTGDQLDEEIVRIVNNNFDSYECKYIYSEINEKYFWRVCILGECATTYSFRNINPLIAKIKLLKQLLK